MTTAKPARRGVPQPLHGGPQRFGPYLLEARLAVGTTTEVYLARDVSGGGGAGGAPLPSRFVVKRLLPHLVTDTDGMARFERESLLHAAVSHQNVVRALARGTTEHGEPYLAMEYVDGCDVFRLLRRTTHERSLLPQSSSIRIAREGLLGLSAIHAARDASGAVQGIVHRDVTPSNIYLSRAGDVKIGDFGIARSLRSMESRPAGELGRDDASLMGKFSYLAPEQVAGEPFDQRADLFSMATVLAELLLGKALFPGTGQLQILLAIRDCNLTPLTEAEGIPKGLIDVLVHALAREPELRFPDALAFEAALSPFVVDADAARRELAARVTRVQTVPSDAHLAAVREAARATRPAPEELPPAALPSEREIATPLELDLDVDVDVAFSDDQTANDRDTGMYPELQSFVHRPGGERVGPLTFSRLVEAIATGAVGRGARIDYLGLGVKPIEEIPDLARLLPSGAPEPVVTREAAESYVVDLEGTTMLDVLAHVLITRQTGLLVVTRPEQSDGSPPQHRELYFIKGRLHHVVSTQTGERLGESLVRRGKLRRDELDMALAVLPRYGGRIGDTLIGLGLVDSVDIFRAIREQGRDRVTELFTWRVGSASFRPDANEPAVEFPLDLDIPTLMLAGMEASHPGDTPMAYIEPQLDAVLVPHPRHDLAGFTWPPVVTSILSALSDASSLRDVLSRVTKTAQVSGADVARGLELLLAVDLARWQ
jgi:serine/threonine-protein kinase